jgi:DNA-binding CsgD family transcriptional regulator
MQASNELNRIMSDARHPVRVPAAVQNKYAAATIEAVLNSWHRCLSEHGVEPGSRQTPRILTARELKEFRGPIEELVAAAREENDHLYAIVGKVGYGVFLASPDGIVVDYRGDQARADEFKYWGIWGGGVWSETVEGTNGIGTCIAEQRPVTVHRAQHYRTRHTNLSCSGAPIFGPDGNLAAVLDITSIDPDISDRSHALALAMTIDSARVIEEQLFRRQFHREWIVVLGRPFAIGKTSLLAVDQDQRIIGADRHARAEFGLDDSSLAAGASLWTFFDRRPAYFCGNHDATTALLTRVGPNHPWRALITPPQTRAVTTSHALIHAASPTGLADSPSGNEAAWQPPKGLTPGVRHRAGKALETRFDVSRPPHGQGLCRPIAYADEKSVLTDIAAMLSPREQSILELIGRGRSNKEIARALRITPETVKSHVKNMFAKLGVERRAQAVYRAKSFGLL